MLTYAIVSTHTYCVFIVPPPISVFTDNITNPNGGPLFIPRGVTTNISLVCSVILDTLVDVPVTLNYHWTRNDLVIPITTEEYIGDYSANMVTISPLTLEKAGVYTCDVTVTSTSTSMFIDGTGKLSNATNVVLCKF